jgi:hypothetical protein
MLRALAGLVVLAGAAAAQPPAPSAFIQLQPAESGPPVWLAPAQVVRIGRVETYTVIDTAAFVQQRTIEPADTVARRVSEAGHRLIPLTDLNGRRMWLAADHVVAVRESQERHAAGARAAIVLVGLRFSTDVAVRQTVEEVMQALLRPAGGVAPAE